MLLVLGFVAHNGGAGWVQALVDMVAGAVAVGLIGPAFAVRAATVTAVAVPGDATAGLPVEIELSVSTRVQVVPLMPKGAPVFLGPSRFARPRSDEVLVVLPRRGVYDAISLERRSAAPFGMLWWRRRIEVPLPRELCVAPRLGRAGRSLGASSGTAGTAPTTARSEFGDAQSGVRPYRPGDRENRVHWPATAHAGALMVREVDRLETDPVVVEVTLPEDADVADEIAEWALGTVVALRDGGSPVLLLTTEVSGERLGAVADRGAAGRRLARAVARADRVAGVALRNLDAVARQ